MDKLKSIVFGVLFILLSSFLITPQVNAEDFDDLIISEYIEGSSYNKALELYNGSGETIDLSEYTIVNFTNGASQDPEDGTANSLQLEGQLETGKTFVIVNSRAGENLLNKADLSGSSSALNFNGDDAIAIFKNYDESSRSGNVIDSIGKVGEDPGSFWGNEDTKTQDQTLVRDYSIKAGDRNLSDEFTPADEWIAFYKDTFDNLGIHEEVQPPSGEIEDEYIATVDRIVDGDTLHIEDPIMGETTIRFLNMDTPETYHMNNYDESLILEDPDHSQKYHGDQATAYLQELLQPGDEIVLKLGEEPMDTYGRILAEVIRTEDNLNTNLELVRQGYASSYFIWPIGEEETYQQYQNAVQEAINNNRGIWSEDTPLMELPFEFRSRYDDRALYRMVGDSETMQYYLPNDYEEVPVSQRIFFEDEMTALNAGYEPAFDREPIIADARVAPEGSNVLIEGTVTHKVEASGMTNYYVQDDTAGIVVRTGDLNANVGDQIRAAGTTTEYYGMLQIEATSSEVLQENSDQIEPPVISSSQLGEELEAQLAKIEDVEILSVNQYNDYTARDADGEFVIDNDAGFLEVGKTYDSISGVIDYNYNEFKLMPRSESDVQEELPMSTISEVRQAELDTRVNFKGVITAAYYAGGKYNYYVQDDTAGIVVRASEFGGELGDEIQVKARTEEYFGLLQVIPSEDNVEILNEDVGVPEAKVISSTEIDESLEGQLVTVENVTIEPGNQFGDYPAYDKNGSFVIDSVIGDIDTSVTYESITGVLTYNYDEYKLMPRFEKDLVVQESLLGNYLEGEATLTEVTESILEMAEEDGIESAMVLLQKELEAEINTNGNTEQHIKSGIKHIEKSLNKYFNKEQPVELKKIEKELEKLFKRNK
ncbi:hypothetical protein CEY16_10800 [Halalkalibacillus sediminis]|uniref:Endonuclease n=1 Tax=Halalkalibacillus sediminis TaxID=2018042 RepID=A0A2I0QSX6_9BACI|nr:thermonuclease family protein [Halalkalibacillus sediminis]PKR77220.1 hypothetical protein CEY16_10800 [Halalkalibacillus sediminis]